MHSTRDISWDRVLHHLSHGKANSREQEWKKGVEKVCVERNRRTALRVHATIDIMYYLYL